MSAGARENTVSSLLAAYLREKGINAATHVGVEVPGEHPKEPDFEIKNAGVFYGEAKWESNYWEGITDARDYEQKLGGNGTWTIGYPDALKEEVSQARLGETQEEAVLSGHKYRVGFFRPGEDAEMSRIELEDLPQWLDNHIYQKVQPEADPEEVVEVFRQTASALTREIEEVDAPDLFRNVMGVEPEEKEQAKAVQQAAGYLLVNQIAFYRVLSSVKEYPRIEPDELDRPADLNNYFQRVLFDDYSAIFYHTIANAYAQEHLPLLRKAVKSIYQLSPERINHEVLGTVFHELTPLSVRKPLAAYYTMNKPAQVLAHLAIDDPDAKVMDPACGSGTLLSAAYRRKRELKEDFTGVEHKQFVGEDITGIDIMPFAAHLSTIHLALEAPAWETDRVRIGIEDSTKLEPGSNISPVSHMLPESVQGQKAISDIPDEYDPDWIEKEKIDIQEKEFGTQLPDIDLEKVDVIIMNPPFSRQESVARFSTEYKQKLRERFSDYEDSIHGKMSYCSYFMLLADKFLDKGGKMATVLPASFLTKSSDRKVRKLLLDKYDLEYLAARADKPNFSEDTAFREILLVAEKRTPEEEPTTAYISLDGLDISPQDVKEAANQLQGEELGKAKTKTYPKGSFTVRRFSTRQLDQLNLFAPFAVENHELFGLWRRISTQDDLEILGNLDTGLIRGIGSHDWQEGLINNPTAKLRNKDIWVVEESHSNKIIARHRRVGETVKLPRNCLVPDFHRYAGRSLLDNSDLEEYAVVEDPEDDRFFELIGQDGIPQSWRGNVSNNLQKRLSHIALMRRPDLTAPGTHHLAYYTDPRRLFHAMWIMPKPEAKTAKQFAVWLDSSFNLLQMLLHRQPRRGGLAKYEKHTVSRFKVIAPEYLSASDEQILIEAFDSVADVEFPSLFKQYVLNTPEDALSKREIDRLSEAFGGMEAKLGEGFEARRKLDSAVLDVLGISDRAEILARLYPALLNELVAMKKMMT